MTGVETVNGITSKAQLNGRIQKGCFPKTPEMQKDSVELSNDAKIPEIGCFRLAFNRLTPEQIAMVNESGKLPPNAKFVRNPDGQYSICNNIFGLRVGTRTLPAGYELRRDALGFTRVLPVDSEGLLIQSK